MTAERLTPLRQEHQELTRARILDAAAALMCEVGEDRVTMASVADRAGVSERTVYRHFETRQILFQSVWERMLERVGSAPPPRNADELISIPVAMFPRFDDERELVRGFLYARATREPGSGSSNAYQGAMRNCVRDALPDLDEHRLRRRAAIAELLTSAYAWEMMCQLWNFDGIEAGDAAAEALMVLLGQRRADEGQS